MDKEILQSLVQQYREKIRLYEAMVAEFEREMAAASPSLAGPMPNGSKQQNPTGDPSDGVRAFQFFNKSQTEAAKLLLEFVGHPLLTQQIVDGIEKGGVSVGGKSATAKKLNIYSILRRSNDFVRWQKDTWGLPSWPGAPKRTDSDSDEDAEKSTSDQDK